MEIPTRDDFDRAIGLLAEVHAGDLAGRGSEVPADLDALVNLLEDAEGILKARFKNARSSPASQWLVTQRAFELSNSRAFPLKRLLTLEERAKDMLSAFDDMNQDEAETYCRRYNSDRTPQKILEIFNSTETKERRFRQRVVKFLERRLLAWEQGVMKALCGYHHGERWHLLYNEFARKKELLVDAVSGIGSVAELSRNEIGGVALPRTLEKVRVELEKQLQCGIESIYPITKRDKTSPERALVYDLYKNNRTHLHGTKVSIISELLRTAGIRHPQDNRTIERMISNWVSREQQYRRKMA